jgi:hypothetical protein
MNADRRDALLIFVLLAVTYGYFAHSIHSSNVTSRLGLIFAVVEEGRLTIDSYYDRSNPPTFTIDKSLYDGHYYSDKSPGTAILGVVVYAPLHWVLLALGLDLTSRDLYDLVRYLITLLAVGLPSALAGALLFSVCGVLSQSRWQAYVVTMAITLGTMMLPFSTLLFGHALAAALLFAGFFMIFQLKAAPANQAAGYMFAIGLILAFAVMAEYSAAIVAVPLAASGSRPRCLEAFCRRRCTSPITGPVSALLFRPATRILRWRIARAWRAESVGPG